MNNEEEYNVAARYRTIRKHLDSLGYKQAISLDALPLIEKLLADLIQTTESLKHFKSIAQDNIEACSQLQLTVDPYKCDNARLVRECNQLHLNLIESKEAHQKQIKDLKREGYKLECECNDLQLASSRNLQKIKELEAESSKKSKKILELQGKCLKPTVSNIGLASKKRACYPLRRPVLEGEPLPRTGSKVNQLPNSSSVEPKVVDLLSMADHKISCLSHEVTKLKGELSLQTDNLYTTQSQLTAKEKEILRLKKMLEGGRPYSAVCKDCSCKRSEENFVMSNGNVKTSELRILQQVKSELEEQLKDALNKQHSAMTQALKLAERNEELEKELRDIDHIALAVEADCNSAVKENNKKVCKLQEKLEEVFTQVHILEGELTIERRQAQELRADLEACKLEKRNIQRTLESTVDEKKQMTDRINELTVIEKSLNDEIERLAKENENRKQDVIQLQYANKTLKNRLHWKEIIQGGDEDDPNQVKRKGEKNDDNKASENYKDMFPPIVPENTERDFGKGYNEEDGKLDEHNVVYSDLLKRLCEKESQIATLHQTIKQLRIERDCSEEYNSIKNQNSRVTDKDNADLWMRIRELKRELSNKESAIDDLCREKKELSHEKANLELRLQACRTEHRKTCRSYNVCKHMGTCNCTSSPTSMKDSNTSIKTMFERVEHARDVAQADVERLIEERDALRERLKMATEAHTSEQRRLRESLADVETRLKYIEKERQDLLLAQGTRRATINGLEDQLDDTREELIRTKQELATQRTQYFQLRALQDQTDQALEDVQNQLTQAESDLNKAADRNRSMERQQMQLDNQIKELKQEINNLRLSMTHLDHEKDQLMMVLDEKTEKIVALEREIQSKEQQRITTEQQISELQHKNEICVNQSVEQERLLRSLQFETENLQRQLYVANSDREKAIQENRRFQDDLGAVTCEVRNFQRELEASRAESYDLKRQLQTYVSEVRRAEELLNKKENDRTEMLNHFRSLSLEATVLENNNHSLESEAAETRGALMSTRGKLLDLERQLADKDSLIAGYEAQIHELTQNVASMETQLRQHDDHRHRTESDLNAVRDLCVKLDHQKDMLVKQLDDKDSLKTECDAQICRLKAEQTLIQDQMSRDRAAVERLETLLDQARQESMNVQTNNQELQNEMSRLKNKISELQTKLSVESTELRQYQNQAAEYSKQISELRRQVTNERFDRARKDEENRRSSKGFSSISVKQGLSSISLRQAPSVQDHLRTSNPNSQVSNEWKNTNAHRCFQKQRDDKQGVVADRSDMKISTEFKMLQARHSIDACCRCMGEKDTNKPESATQSRQYDGTVREGMGHYRKNLFELCSCPNLYTKKLLAIYHDSESICYNKSDGVNANKNKLVDEISKSGINRLCKCNDKNEEQVKNGRIKNELTYKRVGEFENKIREWACQKVPNQATDIEFNISEPLDFTSLRLINILIQIKAHRRNLEEQFISLSRIIKKKKKAMEVPSNLIAVSCEKYLRWLKQRRDVITQTPEKKNAYVQKPESQCIGPGALLKKDIRFLPEESSVDLEKKKNTKDNTKARKNAAKQRSNVDADSVCVSSKSRKCYDVLATVESMKSLHFRQERSNETAAIVSSSEPKVPEDKKKIGTQVSFRTEEDYLETAQKYMQSTPLSCRSSEIEKQTLCTSTSKSKNPVSEIKEDYYECFCLDKNVISNEPTVLPKIEEKKKKSNLKDASSASYFVSTGTQPLVPKESKKCLALLFKKRINMACFKPKFKKPESANLKPKYVTCCPVLCKARKQKEQLLLSSIKRMVRRTAEEVQPMDSVSQIQSQTPNGLADKNIAASTQSSDLYIMAATSVSLFTLHKTAERVTR